jgi:hypothetical protein
MPSYHVKRLSCSVNGVKNLYKCTSRRYAEVLFQGDSSLFLCISSHLIIAVHLTCVSHNP